MMANLLCNLAFEVLSEKKYEEALTREEKEMTKQILAFLRQMLIYGEVLSEKPNSLDEFCYRTALSWKKEYQQLHKMYGNFRLVSAEKIYRKPEVVQRNKIEKNDYNDIINHGQKTCLRMVDDDRKR